MFRKTFAACVVTFIILVNLWLAVRPDPRPPLLSRRTPSADEAGGAVDQEVPAPDTVDGTGAGELGSTEPVDASGAESAQETLSSEVSGATGHPKDPFAANRPVVVGAASEMRAAAVQRARRRQDQLTAALQFRSMTRAAARIDATSRNDHSGSTHSLYNPFINDTVGFTSFPSMFPPENKSTVNPVPPRANIFVYDTVFPKVRARPSPDELFGRAFALTSKLLRDVDAVHVEEPINATKVAQATVIEGRCLPVHDNHYSRNWTADELRVAQLLDQADAQELAGTSQSNAAATESSVLRWMRKSRWFLDTFPPPFNESSCKPVAGGKPDDHVFNVRRSDQRTYAFYSFNNMCISADGGGLSATFPKGLDHLLMYTMNDLQEERRQKIRNQLYVWNREKINRTAPTCFVDTPVLLHPILFQSDNLGHVLYRLLATRSLLRDFQRIRGQGYEDTVLGMYITSSAEDSFGVRTRYRNFYQMLGHKWFSVRAPGNIFAESPHALPKGTPEFDLCFRRIFLGWSIVPMYQKRIPKIAGRDLKMNGPAVARFKNNMLTCFKLAERSVVTGVSISAASQRVHVTLLSRRVRRILNQAEFAHRIAAWYPDADVHVVDLEGMSMYQQVQLASRTDILIGIHGTALQYVLAQPAEAVMIEIQYAPGKHFCTDVGINSANRVYCEFGRTSAVARVTHIVHRVTARETSACSRMWHDCDITLTVPAMQEMISQAMCSLRVGTKMAASQCSSVNRMQRSMLE